MSGVGLLDDYDVTEYLSKAKIDGALQSYDELSANIEQDFQAFCPQSVKTTLFMVPIPSTIGYPQRFIIEMRLCFTENSGTANSSVNFRVGVTRAGVTTGGAFTAPAYTYLTNANFGSPPMNITISIEGPTILGTLFIATYATINNVSAKCIGTVKLIRVLSQ